MKVIRISSDIIPLGEFKTGISSCLKRVQATSHPLIITQNGRPAAVLSSPEEYDNLMYRKQFIESVEQGLMAAEAGEVYKTEEVRSRLAEKRAARGIGVDTPAPQLCLFGAAFLPVFRDLFA
ncbi:MAG: type II toxin-antitoxin system Phd/YefM family antitoxin [Desulfobulbaceae bacterium]|nr:type II toxin-antitoxin system Phd/YefM family antitoxin [Desulfobulbaceae bacterium]